MSDDPTKFKAPFCDGTNSCMYWMEARNVFADRYEFGMSGGGAYQTERYVGTNPIDSYQAARLASWIVERLPPELVAMVGAAVAKRGEK